MITIKPWMLKAAIILGIVLALSAGSFYGYVRSEVNSAKGVIQSQTGILSKYQIVGGGVYTAPELILPGDMFSQEYITGRLLESGYRQDNNPNCEKCFTIIRGKVVVRHPSKAEGAEILHQFGRVDVEYSSGVIQAIKPAGQLIIPARFLRQNDDSSRKNATGNENPLLRKAIEKAEDKNFMEHSGVDYFALLKAVLSRANLDEGVVTNGTTLTMQAAKGLLLQQMQKGYVKQAKAMIYAKAMEEIYTKDQIYQLYINHVYLGPDTYGFPTAARRYFCVGLESLDETQSAALAGKLRSPTTLGPATPEGRKGWAKRTNQVLSAMGSATTVEDRYFQRKTCPTAPARQFVRSYWDEVLAAGNNGRTETNVHPYIQFVLDSEVSAAVKTLPQPSGGEHGTQLLALAIDPNTGYVLGESQAGKYGQSLLSYPFTDGSSVKPFVYAAALTQDINGLDDPLPDELAEYSGHHPTNYDKKFLGPISWYRALVLSRNPPAVFVGSVYGFSRLEAMFKDLGFADCPGPYPPIAEGQFGGSAVQLALAYSVFATGGKRPTQVLALPGTNSFQEHFNQAAIMRVNAALRDVILEGTLAKAGKGDKFRGRVFGKTGSATEGVVLVLFTRNVVLVIWAGSVENKPLKGTAGSILGSLGMRIMNRILTPMPRLIGDVAYDATAETPLVEEEQVVPPEAVEGENKPKPVDP